MCTYSANDFSQFSPCNLKKLSAPEIVDNYLKYRKNKDNQFLIKGTNLNDCYNSLLTNESTLMDSFSLKPKFLRDTKTDITTKYNNFIEGLQNEKDRRLNKYNLNRMKNVDVLNIRYKDTNTNFHFLSTLPKFKNITQYNNKARNFYSMDLAPNKGSWRVGTSAKVWEYRNKFENKFNF